jgi:hypothetical protein
MGVQSPKLVTVGLSQSKAEFTAKSTKDAKILENFFAFYALFAMELAQSGK